MARGLLILSMPFRDKMKDIHSQDVKKWLHDNQERINNKRRQFEKYKVMTDLINKVQRELDKVSISILCSVVLDSRGLE